MVRHQRKSSSKLTFASPVHASMTWHQLNPGYLPPPTWPSGIKKGKVMTYDDWIICQDYFESTRPMSIKCDNIGADCHHNSSIECPPNSSFKAQNMWSPRRGHTTTIANGMIFVIGGRAREHVVSDDTRIVGGSSRPNYMTAQDYSTSSEQSVLKNDIWMSADGGQSWKLITPGCMDQQEDVLIKTEISQAAEGGVPRTKCSSSSDCYGDAQCKILKDFQTGVCVCPMFGVREHHSVVVQHRHITTQDNTTFTQDYMYLIGGFTTIRNNFCEGNSCGSRTSYRVAMNDVWVSNNGRSWLQLKPALSAEGFRARGGHSSLLIHSNPFMQHSYNDRIFVFGGEHDQYGSRETEYLNDTWVANLTSTPCCHLHGSCKEIDLALKQSDIGICLPEQSNWYQIARNAGWSSRSGHTTLHETPSSKNKFMDMVYLIGGRDEHAFHSDVWAWDLSYNKEWEQDFQTLDEKYKERKDKDSTIVFHDNQSNLAELMKSILPLPANIHDDEVSFPKVLPYLTTKEVIHLQELGVNTILDLSNTNLYTMLKLRGFNFPGKEIFPIPHICYLKALVDGILKKCAVQDKIGFVVHNIHNCKVGDERCLLKHWDGCAPLDGYTRIDVEGIGFVTVPKSQGDATVDVENMYCKQIPGPRYFTAGAFIDGKVMIMGGKGADWKHLYQDVWSRDGSYPQASIKVSPASDSTQSQFIFDSDEDGANQFEYKIFDNVERLDVTPWLPALSNETVDVSWLDSKKGGPGSGWYTLYLIAIDPSGNRDVGFVNSKNVHTWYYLQPLPWGKISLGIVGFIILSSLTYITYRKRQQKAMLERFAKRQMKRKFKLHTMSKDGQSDWKDYYHNQAIRRRRTSSAGQDKSHHDYTYSKASTHHIIGRSKKKVMQHDSERWKERRRERRVLRGRAMEKEHHSSEDEDFYYTGTTPKYKGRKKKISK